ncbi:MAG: hypothetical protein AB8B99_16175 [Phormidesmis sp.]
MTEAIARRQTYSICPGSGCGSFYYADYMQFKPHPLPLKTAAAGGVG